MTMQEFTSPLRGASFRTEADREVTASLTIGNELELIPEPDNAYDSNAIRVYYQGSFLGFVAKEVAMDLAPAFALAASYTCVVDYFVGPLTPIMQIELETA